jgi:peptidoglycan/LPS O-acetylase OafA/YrhL
MSGNKQLYFKNLDGLRAIAALSVIFAHISYWFQYPATPFFENLKMILSFNQAGGRLGVIFFFVLSGFLITYLMYEEQSQNSRLGIRNFYVRRVLRIWPLYYATLVVGFIIFPILVSFHGHQHHENANWLWYLFFGANFDHIYNYFPSTGILGVQWSVCVEEQFYLLWPLVFVAFNKKKYFPFLLIFLIIASDLFYGLYASGLKAGDYHFGSCFRYLAFGSIIGYICFHHIGKVKSFLSLINKPFAMIIYMLCLALMFFQYQITHIWPSYDYFYHIIPVLFFGYVIVDQNFSSSSFFKISQIPTLAWLGKISYGLYLTHMIAINIVLVILPQNTSGVILQGFLALGITILISYISYYYFEKYFLSLKTKFSR